MTEHIQPTDERKRRGVELVEQAIADEEGNPSQPYRSIEVLAKLESRGEISGFARDAGEDFARQFRRAQFDSLRAADLSRTLIDGKPTTLEFGEERARRYVFDVISDLGGIGDLRASSVWHIVGMEWSIDRWAREFARCRYKKAAAILKGALSDMGREYELAFARR